MDLAWGVNRNESMESFLYFFNRDCFGHGSHHRPSSGTGQKEEVASDFYQFIYLAFGLSLVLLGMVVFLAPPVLTNIGLEAQVAAVAVSYLWYLSIGIIPLLLFSVIRSLLDSLGLTKLSMYLMLLLLPLNSGFNYLLIYGAFGFPELGGAGAGLGTSLAYWVLLGISILVLFKQERLKALHLENAFH